MIEKLFYCHGTLLVSRRCALLSFNTHRLYFGSVARWRLAGQSFPNARAGHRIPGLSLQQGATSFTACCKSPWHRWWKITLYLCWYRLPVSVDVPVWFNHSPTESFHFLIIGKFQPRMWKMLFSQRWEGLSVYALLPTITNSLTCTVTESEHTTLSELTTYFSHQ